MLAGSGKRNQGGEHRRRTKEENKGGLIGLTFLLCFVLMDCFFGCYGEKSSVLKVLRKNQERNQSHYSFKKPRKKKQRKETKEEKQRKNKPHQTFPAPSFRTLVLFLS